MKTILEPKLENKKDDLYGLKYIIEKDSHIYTNTFVNTKETSITY